MAHAPDPAHKLQIAKALTIVMTVQKDVYGAHDQASQSAGQTGRPAGGPPAGPPPEIQAILAHLGGGAPGGPEGP